MCEDLIIDSPTNLANRRILVIEDELLLALDLEELLTGVGCTVVGPVSSREAALTLLEGDPPDAVTLDLNLNGDMSTSLVETLRQRDIPFLVVSGYSMGNGPEFAALAGVPFVTKPYQPQQLLDCLSDMLR